jgi:hypothetical protein
MNRTEAIASYRAARTETLTLESGLTTSGFADLVKGTMRRGQIENTPAGWSKGAEIVLGEALERADEREDGWEFMM